MTRVAILLLAAMFLTQPALAHDLREPGDLQRYGGLWRYQKRDWSHIFGRPNPGVCWLWDARGEQWLWTC